MFFNAPSSEHPYDVSAPNGTVGGLTSLAAIGAAIDAAEEAHTARGPDEVPWMAMVDPSGLMELPREVVDATPTIGIGLGAPRVVVEWFHEDGGNAQSLSERPEDAADHTEIEFCVDANSENSYVTPAALVPAAAAREALREWIRAGRRPGNIAWEEL